MEDEQKEWVELGDYIWKLVEEKQTTSVEFQALAKVFGIKKLREIYKKEKERRANEQTKGNL